MKTCDEETAKFMSGALLDHAKEICRYAKAYREPIFPDANMDNPVRAKFMTTVERMVKEMHALLLMAEHKGISRYCNREQIEAYMEEARAVVKSVIAGFKKSASQFN